MEVEINIVEDVTGTALELVTTSLVTACAARGRAVMCLSGGSTPVPLYRSLAQRADLPWARTVLAWGDERYVKHDHPDSNYGAAKRLLVDNVGVLPANVLPWPEGPTPADAAERYARDLAAGSSPARTFDINIMGLGSDGHTASLFPGTGTALREEDAFAADVPGVGWRLTLGAGRLSDSRVTLFLVSGEDKRKALLDAFGPAARGESARSAAQLDLYPARAISARERLVVITDVDFLA